MKTNGKTYGLISMSDLTLKSAKALYLNLGETIRDLEMSTDKTVDGIKQLNNMGVEDPIILNHHYASLYLNFIYLDMCAAYRLYLSGTTHYEQRFAVKQLYTIMNEGYKRLYGFDNKSTNPNKKIPQKGSIWATYISCYSNCGIHIIEKAYEESLSILEKFNDPIIFDKTARCHGAHYHEDYEAIYNFLKDLNAEKVTVGATHFFEFLIQWRKLISIIGETISLLLTSLLNQKRND